MGRRRVCEKGSSVSTRVVQVWSGILWLLSMLSASSSAGAHAVVASPAGTLARSAVELETADSHQSHAVEPARSSRYIPVKVRRGQHRLPSLASEEAPHSDGYEEAEPRPEVYLPTVPLGMWRSEGGTGQP